MFRFGNPQQTVQFGSSDKRDEGGSRPLPAPGTGAIADVPKQHSVYFPALPPLYEVFV